MKRALALVLFCAACSRKATTETTPSAAPSLAAAPKVVADAGPAVTDASAPNECGLAADAVPKSGKSIGHTSVVFKLELTDGKTVAWKPDTRRGRGRFKGEIAAFRLAKALDLPNVPAACFRAFDAAVVRSVLATSPETTDLLAEELVVENNAVSGVVIPWIDGLQFLPLEKDPLRAEARGWLADHGTIPPAKMELARQISTLIVFDYLTTNWDRYSGANVGLDKTGEHLLFVDNDAAFMEGPPKGAIARNKARLETTDRFSRSLVTRLRTLDEDRIVQVLGDERPGKPLFTRLVALAVAGRIKELLTLVDAKIRTRGDAPTLYFP